MLLEPIDIDHLPNTSNIDGVPIYANPIKFIRRLFLKRLELCLNLLHLKNGNILDVGSGSGIILPTLSRINGLIVGLDLHKNLNRVHSYLKKNKFLHISLIHANSDYLPFRKGIFNSILCISSLDHLIDPHQTISELYRVSAEKGTFISGIRTPNYFYYILTAYFILFYILSYFIIFRNYTEFFSASLKMHTWKHMYSDTDLHRIISKKFKIVETRYLRTIWPVYTAYKSIKKNQTETEI